MSGKEHKYQTDLMMAILAGISGPNASKAWERQKLENDVTWLASELTHMKDENASINNEVNAWRKAGELMLDHINTGWTAEYRVVDAINAAKQGGQP